MNPGWGSRCFPKTTASNTIVKDNYPSPTVRRVASRCAALRCAFRLDRPRRVFVLREEGSLGWCGGKVSHLESAENQQRVKHFDAIAPICVLLYFAHVHDIAQPARNLYLCYERRGAVRFERRLPMPGRKYELLVGCRIAAQPRESKKGQKRKITICIICITQFFGLAKQYPGNGLWAAHPFKRKKNTEETSLQKEGVIKS